MDCRKRIFFISRYFSIDYGLRFKGLDVKRIQNDFFYSFILEQISVCWYTMNLHWFFNRYLVTTWLKHSSYLWIYVCAMHVNLQLRYSAYLYYIYMLTVDWCNQSRIFYMYSFVLKITILFVCGIFGPSHSFT